MKLKLNEIQQQFVEQNIDQMPQMMKFLADIREQFQEVQKNDGNIVAVLSAYQTIDSIHQEVFADSTRDVSCFGCTAAYCCHQSVDICEVEAELIAQYCKEQRIKIPRKHLQKQLAHNRENIAFKDCSACVFLSKDNRCNIYPVRPAACRIHHVVTPLEYCNTKEDIKVKIGFAHNNAAMLVRGAMVATGGKVDRMPRLLLKYSQ